MSNKYFKTVGFRNCSISNYEISDQKSSPTPVVGNGQVQFNDHDGLKILTDLVPNENATYLIDFTAQVTIMNGNNGTMPIKLTISAPYEPPSKIVVIVPIIY